MSGTVVVRALATLAAFAPPGGTVALVPGETAGDLARRLGMTAEAIGAVLVNGGPAEPQRPLAPGDVVSFVPPITGG